MRHASRRAPQNARFVVAAAECLPAELAGQVDELTVIFPWGSLLRGLVEPDGTILDGLARVLRPAATVEALMSLTDRDGLTPIGAGTGADLADVYLRHGLRITAWRRATADEIARADSSWAKRLDAARRREVWLLRARLA